MTNALRPVVRPRLYEQVVAQLREHVIAAGLRAGDRLPPERELAERLGVSRASIKQAIVVLEVQGLVEVRHGGGTCLLKDTLDVEPLDALIERRRRLPDVLDAREAIETKLAELAAQRRTDAEMAEIDKAVQTMADEVAAGERGENGDRLFHAALAAAAHSELLAEFMTLMDGQVAESRHQSLQQPGRPSQSLRQHRAIAEAIRAGNPTRAARAMRNHLQAVSKLRLLSWNPDDPLA